MLSDYLQTVDWSRAQFAMTAIYHWLFVPLTLGLSIICAIMETIYYRTGDPFWKRTAKFWMRLFGINFAIGVATGLILEFEFGTNWSNYSHFVGDIFGAPLAARIRRESARTNTTPAEAEKRIRQVDKERAAYYNFFSSKRWGDAQAYDLCVNTDGLEISEVAKLVLRYLELRGLR